jgi:hypothetical protein
MRAAGMPKRIKPAKLPEDVWEGDSQKGGEAIRDEVIQEGTINLLFTENGTQIPRHFVAVPSI